ncbi:MAG: hypothetical protein KAW17_01090 [Candidatus Eisenbacteria sp.]|nr:hypothetical protein [Candidatus Eisenbacteria bacterium]
MQSSRVIRPARILDGSFQVMVPQESGESVENPTGPQAELADARRQEQELRAALGDLEKRWVEREKEFAGAESRAEEKVAEAVKRLTSIADDFMAQREDLFKSAEETVLRLAVAIARRVVGDIVAVKEDVVLETVRRALGYVVEKERVTVRVNPEDLRTVREHQSEWLDLVEGTRSLNIEEDERIRKGGCLVETETGNVEAQIEKQLQTLERVLVETVK